MTNKKKYVLILLFIALLVGTLSAQQNPDSWFFVQITDPQFGFMDENKSFDQEIKLYSEAIRKINQLTPDLVIITGDFVNRKHDKAQNEAFVELTKQFDPSIPVWLIPGNHDIGQNPAEKDLERYRVLYGPDRFSFQHKNCAFIGINSVLIKSAQTGQKEEEQFEWLVAQLDNYRQVDRIFIFTHYPFFIKNIEEEEKYSNLSREARQKYFELFINKNVSAVFAGHYHNNGYGEYKGIPMITTSALGKPLSKAPSGLRIIKVTPDSMEHTYYAVDEIPDKLE